MVKNLAKKKETHMDPTELEIKKLALEARRVREDCGASTTISALVICTTAGRNESLFGPVCEELEHMVNGNPATKSTSSPPKSRTRK